MEDIQSSQFETADQVINSLLRKEGDIGGVKKLQYKEFAKDVYEELNITGIKQTKRVMLPVDRRLGVAAFPQDFYALSSLSLVTEAHRFEPMLLNTNLSEDIVDVSLSDCGCECGCQSSTCASVKNYELISEEVEMPIPDGGGATQTYTKTQRKFVKSDGSFYLEIIEPVISYVDGVAAEIVMNTSQQLICKLEVKDCGCVTDCDANCQVLKTHCSSVDYEYERGSCHPRYFEHCQKGNYNISHDNKRIILPEGFDYPKIMLRYYAHLPTKSLLIPRMAKKAFQLGIKYEAANFDKTEPLWRIQKWQNDYINAQTVMRSLMSRCTLHDFYATIFGIR